MFKYLPILVAIFILQANDIVCNNHESLSLINTKLEGTTNAKEIKEISKTANRLYKENKFKEALKLFLKLDKLNDESDLEVKYMIALCYLQSNVDKASAIDYLKESRDHFFSKGIEEDYFYYLGIAYHLIYRFDEAIVSFDKFLSLSSRKDERNPKVLRLIENSMNGKKLTNEDVKVEIENLGKQVNSPYPDYTPVISADESILVINSRRMGSTGGLQNRYGEPDKIFGSYFEDIYVSINVNDNWLKSLSVGSPLNTEDHDAVIGISPDGQKLFVYRTDSVLWGNIFISSLRGYDWGPLEKLPSPINSEFQESSASITADGKKIYFTSNRPRTEDGVDFDLYFSEKLPNGSWSIPTNLGSIINTQYNEISPYIHPDGKSLYFSSTGHNSMGGYDIFMSSFKDGTWSVPQNIGYPINTPEDDIDFVLAANGKRGYYASVRPEGHGEKDIYVIHFSKDFEDVAPDPVTLYKGIIRNCEGYYLNADIVITDIDKKEELTNLKSNSATGKYIVILPKGGKYKVSVKAEGYLPYYKEILTSVDEIYKENVLDFVLCKEEAGNEGCKEECKDGSKETEESEIIKKLPQGIKEVEYKQGDYKFKKTIVSFGEYHNDTYVRKVNLNNGSVEYSKNYKPVTQSTFKFELKRVRAELEQYEAIEVKAKDDILNTMKNKFEYVNILSNDIALKGKLLGSSVRILEQPSNGMVEFDEESGELEYSPNLGFSGEDKLKYKVCNNNDRCANALVYIYVKNPSAKNKQPILKDDVFEIIQNTTSIFDVLKNDYDDDGLINSTTLQIFKQPINGNAIIENNKVKLIPKIGFQGELNFTYKVCDNNGGCGKANIRVNVKYQEKYTPDKEVKEAPELSNQKKEKINEKPTQKDIDIVKNASINTQGEKIVMYNNLYFGHDEFRFRQEFFKELNEVAEYLKKNKEINLDIAEHTDNRGPKYFNDVLSEKRAQEIKSYLTDKKVDPLRIRAVGYGGKEPLKDCSKENCSVQEHKENNRTILKFVKKKGSFKARSPKQNQSDLEIKQPNEIMPSQIELMEEVIHFQDILKRKGQLSNQAIKYRVFVAEYKDEVSDANTMFKDVPGLVIENDFEGHTQYLSKEFKIPSEAHILARILRSKGFMRARVVGYLVGSRAPMLDIHNVLF